MKKWIRRIALGLAGVLVLIVAVGSAYEFISRRAAATRYPAPGKLVDIGGRKIDIDCRGTGTPIVVLEAGLDISGSLAWSAVHDSLATTTRTCAYSRAGIMWSDPSSQPQTGKQIAEDLHATLTAGGEAPPYVMVGHSLGGPYVMIYTRHFGSDVAGVVFVDASHPDQMERMKAFGIKEPSMTIYKVASALAWTGIPRAVFSREEPSGSPEEVEVLQAVNAFAPASLQAMLQEGDALTATLAEAGTFRELGNRPLFVLTAMAPLPPEELAVLEITEEQASGFQDAWKTMHDEEASWSSRSQHELVPDASHYIQRDRPDVVIRAVRAVVDSVRATP
ncbi:MAG: alpha/beta hydrolase [Gemmatimonadota bacterium]|jgi:pimeloyl-ACP methyl ester carboxylesterase|nr:alpha/beta hydrolase [Gemmatimonadota bacterium]